MPMQDLVQLICKAGSGGWGKISFRREKYVPKGGPDGGDGGNGGDILVRATRHRATLEHLSGKTMIEARRGGAGGSRKKHGSNASVVEIEVPVGTRIIVSAQNQTALDRQLSFGQQRWKRKDVRLPIYEFDFNGNQIGDARPTEDVAQIPVSHPNVVKPIEGQLFADLVTDGDTLLLCQGGFGGRGNTHFKSSQVTTPRKAEVGSFGEVKTIGFELRLMAQVGLVGVPSVGKSTLLSVLTKARPKVAPYPFTTLEPQLGIAVIHDRELVIADIPGLIEGAHAGKGLGIEFLRHIAHCKTLCYVLAVPDEVLLQQPPDSELVQLLWKQYQVVKNEIITSDPSLASIASLVVLNKADVYSESLIDKAQQWFEKQNAPLTVVSGATKLGLDSLRNQLADLI